MSEHEVGTGAVTWESIQGKPHLLLTGDTPVVWDYAAGSRTSMLNLPNRATEASAGLDLFAYLHERNVRMVEQPENVIVPQQEHLRPRPREERASWMYLDTPELTAEFTNQVDDDGRLFFIQLKPGDRAIIPLGFKARLPLGTYLAVVPRSGLSFKTGLRIANAPGTIDADYTEEWGVVVENPTLYTISIHHGDRIAQGLILPYLTPGWNQGQVVQSTERTGGWGSTGR